MLRLLVQDTCLLLFLFYFSFFLFTFYVVDVDVDASSAVSVLQLWAKSFLVPFVKLFLRRLKNKWPKEQLMEREGEGIVVQG